MNASDLVRVERGIDTRGEDECWPWKKALTRAGYPVIRINRKNLYVHRLIYKLRKNQNFDVRLQVLHHCDNPCCCNPKHLFEGTHLDNMEDKFKKGRHSYGETHGNCQLTDTQVEEIKKHYRDGLPQIDIAVLYKINQSTVSRIINYKRRHLDSVVLA